MALDLKKLNLTPEQQSGLEPLGEAQEAEIAEQAGSWEQPVRKEKEAKEPEDGEVVEELEDFKDTPAPETEEVEGSEPTEDELKAAEAEESARLEAKAKELNISVDKVKEQEAFEAEQFRKEEEAKEAEEQRLEAKAKELKKTKEEVIELEAQAKAKAEQLEIEAIAREEKISVQQAKEMIQKDREVAERHKHDPIKLARSLRKFQSEASKSKAEAEENKLKVKQYELAVSDAQFEAGCEEQKAQIIEAYREDPKFAAKAAELEDDECFERAKEILRVAKNQYVEQEKQKTKTLADEKRKEYLQTIPEDISKEFYSELEEHVNSCTDMQVLNPKFNMEHIIALYRGKKYTPEYIKQLKDEAYRRGMENRKILGRKVNTPLPSKPQVKAKGDGYVTKLSATEKARARSMFAGLAMSENEMYKEYENKYRGKDF